MHGASGELGTFMAAIGFKLKREIVVKCLRNRSSQSIVHESLSTKGAEALAEPRFL